MGLGHHWCASLIWDTIGVRNGVGTQWVCVIGLGHTMGLRMELGHHGCASLSWGTPYVCFMVSGHSGYA
jgi:hypothetical protein